MKAKGCKIIKLKSADLTNFEKLSNLSNQPQKKSGYHINQNMTTLLMGK